MLVVKIELWPGGRHERARLLGVARIDNVGGTEDVGDYFVRLLKGSSEEGRLLYQLVTAPKGEEIWRQGSVEGFPRLRLGCWDLLFRALGALVARRNTGVEYEAFVRGGVFGPSGPGGPEEPSGSGGI